MQSYDRTQVEHPRQGAPIDRPDNDEARTTVVGVFPHVDQARDAIDGLKEAGFHAHDISVVTPHRDQTRAMAHATGAQAGASAVTGLVAGGILGGAAGWLVGVGALAIPGIGPIIAAGALGTAIAGAAVGAGVGVIAGALIGMGIPEEEAHWYEGEVRSGRTLVTVRAQDRFSDAQDILQHYGAYDIRSKERATRAPTVAAADEATRTDVV